MRNINCECNIFALRSDGVKIPDTGMLNPLSYRRRGARAAIGNTNVTGLTK